MRGGTFVIPGKSTMVRLRTKGEYMRRLMLFADIPLLLPVRRSVSRIISSRISAKLKNFCPGRWRNSLGGHVMAGWGEGRGGRRLRERSSREKGPRRQAVEQISGGDRCTHAAQRVEKMSQEATSASVYHTNGTCLQKNDDWLTAVPVEASDSDQLITGTAGKAVKISTILYGVCV